jgi:hypothetical protein
MQELAKAQKITMEKLQASTFRPPVVTIPLGSLAEEEPDEK